MTFISGLLATILEWGITKLAHWGIIEIENIIEKLKMQSQAKSDGTTLAQAKTEDDQKKAVSNIINDTFNS